MGIPKASRKGKKAWRKNIDAKDVEDYLVKESHRSIREPAVEHLKDEDLFVVDKEADDFLVPAALRKRKQHQQKLLRPQLILASHKDGIKPLHVPTKYKHKGPAKPLPGSMPGFSAVAATTAAAATVAATTTAAVGRRKPQRRRGLKVSDIWSQGDANPDQDWTAPASGMDLIKLGKRKQQQQQQQQILTASTAPRATVSAVETVHNVAATAAAAADPARGPKRSKRRHAVSGVAVEVDMPGCSFNPEPEAHQDALGAAVAAEYKKQLADELAPKAPSLYAPEGFQPQDELEALLVDAEADDDDEKTQEQTAQQVPAAMHDANVIDLDDGSESEDGGDHRRAAEQASAPDSVAAAAARKPAECSKRAAAGSVHERKTQKDRNREARKRQQEAELAARSALKQQRRALESLAELQTQLQEEEQQKQELRMRRQATIAERAASEPPRLGKQRYEAAPIAVLTTDEVTGSLRQIKPCFSLSADRFKALQKRGLVEPRKPSGRKLGKKVQYVTGERQERAREAQQEIESIKTARKKAVKSGTLEAAQAVVEMAGGKGSKRKKPQQRQTQQRQLAPGCVVPLEGL